MIPVFLLNGKKYRLEEVKNKLNPRGAAVVQRWIDKGYFSNGVGSVQLIDELNKLSKRPQDFGFLADVVLDESGKITEAAVFDRKVIREGLPKLSKMATDDLRHSESLGASLPMSKKKPKPPFTWRGGSWSFWAYPDGRIEKVVDHFEHAKKVLKENGIHVPTTYGGGDIDLLSDKVLGETEKLGHSRINVFRHVATIDPPAKLKQINELINLAIERGWLKVQTGDGRVLWEREEEEPRKLSAMALGDLEHSESLGADVRELAEQAKRAVGSDRLPTESVAAHAARVNGISKEVLEKADPQTLLRTFTQLTQHIAKVHLGFDDEKAAFWTEKAARLVGMIGQGQGETRVFPASAYTQEGVQRAASFYVPRPNPFIGLYVKPFAAPERTMFEFFHGLGHELFHGKMEQLATRPESLTTDEHTALANLHRAADELKLSTWEMAELYPGCFAYDGRADAQRNARLSTAVLQRNPRRSSGVHGQLVRHSSNGCSE